MNDFVHGLKKGLPIGIGYLAVSFSLGVVASTGLTPLMAAILSLTNLTSSGEYAGIQMILEKASLFEIGLTVLIINLRYVLMSLSLSQKVPSEVPFWKRLIMGFGIADEIYAVAVSEYRDIKCSYMVGIMLLPIIGWTSGTLIGALGASIFSSRLLSSLGIALYTMFIALLVPDAKKSKAIGIVILLSILISVIFEYVSIFDKIGFGFKIIIATIIASTFGALVFPIKVNGEENV